ncbi:hypothetical protein [Kocuria flava]|uniref:hypothetical protein n=1 Tax=Kocuria flava TaxID=446860 RepID=UPI002F938CC9
MVLLTAARTGPAPPAVVGSVVVHRDLDHLTSTYAATLTPDVEQRLRAALGR